jgi:hypothetical protein
MNTRRRIVVGTVGALVAGAGIVLSLSPVGAQVRNTVRSTLGFTVVTSDDQNGRHTVEVRDAMQKTPPMLEGWDSMTTVSADAASPGTVSGAVTFRKGDSVVEVSETPVTGDRSLPNGEKLTLKGVAVSMERGLAGAFKLFPKPALPDGTPSASTAGTPVSVTGAGRASSSGGAAPVLTPLQVEEVKYTDGTRITWFTDTSRVELLTNLPPTEAKKIAEWYIANR